MHRRLLDTIPSRTGVRPDSVQVPDGTLAMRLPTRPAGCGSLSVCGPSGAVDEAWLQSACPARSSTAHLAVPIGTSTGGSKEHGAGHHRG